MPLLSTYFLFAFFSCKQSSKVFVNNNNFDSFSIMAKKPFSIDDAFDPNLDDVVVRVYGSTTIEKPTFGASRPASNQPVDSPGMPPNHPVLLSIRTGILQDDVGPLYLYLIPCFIVLCLIFFLLSHCYLHRRPPKIVIL